MGDSIDDEQMEKFFGAYIKNGVVDREVARYLWNDGFTNAGSFSELPLTREELQAELKGCPQIEKRGVALSVIRLIKEILAESHLESGVEQLNLKKNEHEDHDAKAAAEQKAKMLEEEKQRAEAAKREQEKRDDEAWQAKMKKRAEEAKLREEEEEKKHREEEARKHPEPPVAYNDTGYQVEVNMNNQQFSVAPNQYAKISTNQLVSIAASVRVKRGNSTKTSQFSIGGFAPDCNVVMKLDGNDQLRIYYQKRGAALDVIDDDQSGTYWQTADGPRRYDGGKAPAPARQQQVTYSQPQQMVTRRGG